ncbi:hypothetical protein Tco_0772071 [Tanacetum coccineum]|uniref:Retrotransposon gag domain-containing protein n=1 Tax=Tanacetum coccineum TaxID=301880 RepID=A0ABQ4ZHT4_9ASTR
MTMSSNKDLLQPFKNLEHVFRLSRKLSKTQSLDYLSSSEFNLISHPEDQFEEEETETMGEPTMEEYMTRTREGYGSGIARPKIEDKHHFELKDQFLKELRDNTFNQVMLRAFHMSLTGAASRWLRNKPTGSITTWETLKEIFLNMQEVILFYKGLEVPTRQILDSKGAIPSMKADEAKNAI